MLVVVGGDSQYLMYNWHNDVTSSTVVHTAAGSLELRSESTLMCDTIVLQAS